MNPKKNKNKLKESDFEREKVVKRGILNVLWSNPSNLDTLALSVILKFETLHLQKQTMKVLVVLGAPNKLFCKKAVLQLVFCWEN